MVWTAKGWASARDVKEGDQVYSWTGRSWKSNEVHGVVRGQARKQYSLVSGDGMAFAVLRCTGDQKLTETSHKPRVADVIAGRMVYCSEGASVFNAEISGIDLTELDQPEPVFTFKLKYPKNFLAANFLVRA